MEYQSDEDRDFIVNDAYKHDADPTYVPDEEESSDDDKYVVTGKDFKKLTKAKKLGAESLDYSKRKNNKYVSHFQVERIYILVRLNIQIFFIHKDEERKDKYLARAKKIKNKKGELTYENPESANYWSINLLWSGK